MSEQTIQEALEARLESLSNFGTADVTISDWSVLDGSRANAPFAVISRTGVYSTELLMGAKYEVSRQIRITVYEAFDGDWPDTETALRNVTTAIETELMNNPALGLSVGVGNAIIEGVEGTAQEYVYDQYIPPEQLADALPSFVAQVMEVSVLEEIILTTGEFA